mmetsp:Transcript_5468/g.9475  ORF Transcript_5468/g.9475 Transcript_5468/m.9475 type:complete len:81 (-) Transcript_5468:475-717(-)
MLDGCSWARLAAGGQKVIFVGAVTADVDPSVVQVTPSNHVNTWAHAEPHHLHCGDDAVRVSGLMTATTPVTPRLPLATAS